jgi:hypothetical protein
MKLTKQKEHIRLIDSEIDGDRLDVRLWVRPDLTQQFLYLILKTLTSVFHDEKVKDRFPFRYGIYIYQRDDVKEKDFEDWWDWSASAVYTPVEGLQYHFRGKELRKEIRSAMASFSMEKDPKSGEDKC